MPLGVGKNLRYAARVLKNGVAWVATGAGDCHDIALAGISLTVQQGGVARTLSAPDQCHPAGAKRVATARLAARAHAAATSSSRRCEPIRR